MLTRTHLKIILAASISIAICSILGIIALIILWRIKLLPFQDYALVVDAGSTHTKIFLYTWPSDKSDGRGLTSRVYQVKSCSVNNGPVTTIVHPTDDNVKKYFNPAMTDCINEIPSTRKTRALIFFGATAGLRLSEIQNPSYTNALLNNIRNYFSSLGLLFHDPEYQARIISGHEEALSGWISINTLMQQLYEKDQPTETYGVSDFGGGSTQISFIAPNATENRYTLNLFNMTYDVYSHSYLCYGQEQSRLIYLGQLIKRMPGINVINDSCLQSGYIQNLTYDKLFSTACAREPYAPPSSLNKSTIFSFIGTGNYKKCQIAIKRRFNKSSCSSGNCSFNYVYQSMPISSSMKFIAIAGWYSVFKNLAPSLPLSPNKDNNYELTSINLTQIKHVIRTICENSWSSVDNPDKYRPLLCFNAMLHWTLFEHGYLMTDANLKNFQIVKRIDSTEVGWTLGYMINQTNYLKPQHRPKHLIARNQFIVLLNLCILLFILSVITTGSVIHVIRKS